MIYIGTDHGIYRWFHGSPWPIFHSLQDQRIVALSAASGGLLGSLDSEGRVWESLNNGQDWRALSRPGGTGRPTAMGLVAEPSASWLLASTSPLQLHTRRVGSVVEAEAPRSGRFKAVGRWLSLEGGTATATRQKPRVASWRSLAVPNVDLRATLGGIRWVQTGAGSEAWFASVIQGGLWRSEDQAASWSKCDLEPREVLALRRDGATVAVATNSGVWMSTDGGTTWTERSAGLEQAPHVTAIEIKPGNSKHLLAGCGRLNGELRLEASGLFESKDGGQSWKPVTRGFPVDLESDAIVDIRFDPSNSDFAAIALGSGELWKTFTDGFWWEPLARQIHRARVLCAVS